MELTEFVNFYSSAFEKISISDVVKMRESIAFLEGYNEAIKTIRPQEDDEYEVKVKVSCDIESSIYVLRKAVQFVEEFNKRAYS